MTLTAISSMATQALLQELIAAQNAVAVDLQSVGGVDALARIGRGEAFDVIVLSRGAMDQLAAGGWLRADTLCDVVLSGVAVAVPAGGALPDLSSSAALRAALAGDVRIGVSTGPSGVALQKLFAAWDPSGGLAARVTVSPPGVPVAKMLAQRQVDIGFQQLSELIAAPGIALAGDLPADIQINTLFSAALGRHCRDVPAATRLLAYFGSAGANALKPRHGMRPAA